MSWEYRHLKRRLQLADDPLLLRFERFCEDAHAAMAGLEWSCKLAGEHWLPNRFYWLGRSPTPDLSGELARLVDGLPFAPRGGLPRWTDTLARHTASVLVGYAGAGAGRGAVLKLCLTLTRDAMPAEYRDAVGAWLPRAPAAPPPGDATVVISHLLAESGECSPRLYVLYNEPSYRDPRVLDYMAPLIGDAGLQLARHHPRSGVTLRPDGTALGIALRPSGLRDQPHPSHALSPLRMPLLQLAQRHPLVAERLDRVCWVSLGLGHRGALLDSAALPAEMNLYIVLEDRGS